MVRHYPERVNASLEDDPANAPADTAGTAADPVSPVELGLSRLVCGTMRIPLDDDAAVRELIETSLDADITTFDLADIYGGYRVEATFGRALRELGIDRDSYQLVSKCGIVMLDPARPEHRVKHYDLGADHIRTSVQRTLDELGTDHLDLLLLHRPDPLMNADETGARLDELVDSGLARAVGVSNFSVSQLELLQSRMSNRLATNQIELSVTHTDALDDGTLDHAQLRRYPVMAWSALGGGALFGEDERAERVRAALTRVAEANGQSDLTVAAIAWLLRLPVPVLPVLGTTNPERLRTLAISDRLEFDRQSWFEVLEASRGHGVA